MNAAAPHRGSEVETVVHGRCSLSSLEADGVADAGVAEAGGFAAAFAGVLDNREELAADLRLTGARLELATPQAIVAVGFRVWGDRLAERMRGVFAAAVTDGDRLTCFRDPLGLGSLFHRTDERGFYSATEAKQIIAGAAIPREPDLDVLEATLLATYDSESPAALRGVQRLVKGVLLESDGSDARRRPYWDPESVLETGTYSDSELVERFSELMDRAVRRCLTGADVILLSGGIDSPAVAAFAAPRHRELSGKPLVALTAIYPKYPSVDELPYTTLVADRFDLPLHSWEPPTNPLDGLETWVALADGPVVAGSLTLYEDAYRVARELGHRNVLTGEFAEFVCTRNGVLIDHLLSHGRIRPAAHYLRLRHGRGTAATALAREVVAALAPTRLLASRVRRSPLAIPDWVDRRRANESAADSLVGPRRRWPKLQLSPFVGVPSSVEAEEVCQAVTGVRARRPFADLDLWLFFLSLRAEVKFPDTRTKTLLRRVLRGRVPDEILDRRDKTVFDEAMLANIDYATLRRLLVEPEHRFAGIDYDVLADRLRREEIGIVDYLWVTRLASVHAFLATEMAATPQAPVHV
jgi:asparagine synthase (glutamine-hydrolysing)